MKKLFWRLKRENYYNTASELQKRIPELKKVDVEIITSHLRGSNLDFYKQEKKPIKLGIRLTLPFALIVMLILIILTPINYLITGRWSYRMLWLLNWLKALRIFN